MYGERLRCIGDGAAVVRVTEETVEEDIRVLLDQIHGFYKSALELLPAKAIPSLAPRLLKAGLCFGVLDPISNIMANTISYSPPSKPGDEEEDEEQEAHLHTLESLMSRIITDTDDDDVFDLMLSPGTAERMTVARRSLEGLVSFLIFYFRYLSETEALRYLRLARADLLAAVRLILVDRSSSIDPQNGRPGFSVISLTTKVALGCAAVSAKHPEPGVLVRASRVLAARLDKASVFLPVLNNGCCLTPAKLKRLGKLLKQEPGNMELTNPCFWQPLPLAGSRYHDGKKRKKKELPSGYSLERRKKRKIKELPSGNFIQNKEEELNVTFRYTQTLKILLLDKIHAHYLDALARLPRDHLRKDYHGSLLRAGYCYGPMDPVSNIILNTVWYATAFPTHKDFDVDLEVAMICTKALRRIECCSLYGLVKFLCSLFSTLTEHDAIWFLLVSNVDAASAITIAVQQGHIIAGTYDNAYTNAAVDSWHPDPDMLSKFLISVMHGEFSELLFWLSGHSLSSLGAEQLAMYLSPKCEEEVSEPKQIEMLSVNQKRFISEIRKKFQADQEFYVSKVNSALNKYAMKIGEHFEIHVICGVNPYINNGACSHINFWATPRGANGTGTARVLFFAECSNGDYEEGEESLCYPVLAASIDSVRCFDCEYYGIKIVHPYDEEYVGRGKDFYKMAHGQHDICNEGLINACDFHVDMMCTLHEDWIYFDPKKDGKIAEMNPTDDCTRKIRSWKGRIF